MHELADSDLLRQYAEQDSEPAFAALVTRHLNLVYSVAVRKTGNPHAAEEITQAVFIILAKKARSLRRETVLSGWLYQTARLTAANFLRQEIRRVRREQESYMQSLSPETEAWPQIEPLLDDALGWLNEKERQAIVLRFFEGRSFQEIGGTFGGSENAAKKRVSRALEKLQKFFTKRGVSSTAAMLAGAISANSVQAAPAGLALKISAVAVAKGAAAGTTTLTLVKGALKIMAWTKMKTAVVVAAAGIILLTGVATIALISKTLTPLPPLPTLPDHNGYEDLVRAGGMVSIDSGNYPAADAAQLRPIVAGNTLALILAKSALSNECRVTVKFTEAWSEQHLPELAKIKRLAQAMAAEGKLAEHEGRDQDALAAYLEIVRLGNQADRGGVMIDELVGIAVESIGLAELQKMTGRLDAKVAQAAAASLAELDQQAQTWNEVMRQEDNWSRRTFTGLRNDWLRWLTRGQNLQLFQSAEKKLNAIRAKNRQLQVTLAARAYNLDKGYPPTGVSDLVPDYLSAVPQDPFTGKDMVDLPK
jgi:RNA polymerase sigma factor (sigma-70 family)